MHAFPRRGASVAAFAEYTTDRQPLVHVFEWGAKKRRRTLSGIDQSGGPVTHLSFTGDGKHLLVQTGAPDWVLHYVAWDKGATGKVVATSRNVAPPGKSVSQVDSHPSDPTLIAATGAWRRRAPAPAPAAVRSTPRAYRPIWDACCLTGTHDECPPARLPVALQAAGF